MNKKREYKKLNGDLMKEITNFVIDTFREEEARTIKTQHDVKRANMKALLINYRSLVDHSKNSVYEAYQIENDTEFSEILELMSGSTRENFRVESIKKSAVKTRIMICHIDKMLELYKMHCERSAKSEDKRRYRVIHSLYISEKHKLPEELAEEEAVEIRTIYRDVEAAIEWLTPLMFGVDWLYILQK